jgi:hypothetical protein
MNEMHDEDIDTLLREQFEGPLVDDGFSDRVMADLPQRHRRIAWPLWLGALAGAAACGISLIPAPLLQTGWRDWGEGRLSPSAIGMWLAMAGVAWLASAWAVADGRSD